MSSYESVSCYELAAEWKHASRKPEHHEAYYKHLDHLSLQYIEQDPAQHDFRQDLLDYKDRINEYAPKTVDLR